MYQIRPCSSLLLHLLNRAFDLHCNNGLHIFHKSTHPTDPIFLSALHLYIITDNHSRPFCPYSYHVRVTQLPSFRSTNNLYIFANHEITHFACSFPFSKTHPSHQLLPQLDSNKPLSVQICIYIILSTYRWVRNSVLFHQVMETIPC